MTGRFAMDSDHDLDAPQHAVPEETMLDESETERTTDRSHAHPLARKVKRPVEDVSDCEYDAAPAAKLRRRKPGNSSSTLGTPEASSSDETPRQPAVESGVPSQAPVSRIRALDMNVVNKIAAGEIIVAPVNALKEMVENSVDAGATLLEIAVKDGGLKLLQLTDNGSGIHKDDLPLLCHRHTTSKLKDFKDLETIATYGFRGEALASISQIARVTVTTRTEDSVVAWQANYVNGEMVAPRPGQPAGPTSTAGRVGTQIRVEDLFYNVPIRRRAFRSGNAEQNKILDMVGRYAIHCANVGFSVKKQNEAGFGLVIQSKSSVLDRIRQIYSSAVADELMEFKTASTKWGFEASGYATTANYSHKKTTLLLFINNRCVESSTFRRALERLYAPYLPKGSHPFVYLRLMVSPIRVDVNIHPTKSEVRVLNEEHIIDCVCDHIGEKLAQVDQSRSFLVQTYLPGASTDGKRGTTSKTDSPRPEPTTTTGLGKRRRNSNSLVRTDGDSQKITSMLSVQDHPEIEDHGEDEAASMPPSKRSFVPLSSTVTQEEMAVLAAEDLDDSPDSNNTLEDWLGRPGKTSYEAREAIEMICNLFSVKELLREWRQAEDVEATEVLRKLTFVGMIDEARQLAAIQSGVQLVMIEYGTLCADLLYQLGLERFGNFGRMRLGEPLDIRDLLGLALEGDGDGDGDEHDGQGDVEGEVPGFVQEGFVEVEEGGEWREAVVEKVVGMLVERREMLEEYFGLEISEEGLLSALPLVVPQYTPPVAKLPMFLLRLGPYVDWTEEKACFQTFLRELADFLAPESLPTYPGTEEERAVEARSVDPMVAARRDHVRWAVEHVFCPMIRSRLRVGRQTVAVAMANMTDLPSLYRTFERC